MVLLIGLFVLVCTFVSVPAVIGLGWRIGAVDVPQDARRIHVKKIPRCGGIAVMVPLCIGCLLLGDRSAFTVSALCGSGLMLAVGLIDDVFCLGAWSKLLFQTAAATASVLGSGIATGGNAAAAILWVVALTNAHNLIDGLDGLLCGCAAIEGTLLCIVCRLTGRAEVANVSFLLVMACFGFRFYNRYPAQIFAGDCGSESIGFLLGFLSLPLFALPNDSFSVLTPLFLFAYPLMDLNGSVLRRILHGKSPFAADRAHLHHRLYAAGLSQPECCWCLFSVALSLGTVGMFLCTEALWGVASVACVFSVVVLMRVRLYLRQRTS